MTGSIPHIKEEKPMSAGTAGVTADIPAAHSQSPNTVSPTNPESPYGGNFPGAGVPFTNSNTNTTQSNNDILYDTMSQVYPALSSSLGKHFPRKNYRLTPKIP